MSAAPAAQCGWPVHKRETQPPKQIIGFEIQLRKLLKQLYRYDTLAVAKLVEGAVSDDSFLYFCCNLILPGPLVFRQILGRLDATTAKLMPTATGEFILGVADQAFELKLGSQTSRLLSSEHGQEVYDYSIPSIAMVGVD